MENMLHVLVVTDLEGLFSPMLTFLIFSKKKIELTGDMQKDGTFPTIIVLHNRGIRELPFAE